MAEVRGYFVNAEMGGMGRRESAGGSGFSTSVSDRRVFVESSDCGGGVADIGSRVDYSKLISSVVQS
jgi:hypothetical protein